MPHQSLTIDNTKKAITPTMPPRHVYVSLPAGCTQKAATVQETLPAQSLEQRAEELRRKVQAYAAEHKEEQPANEAEISFTHRTINDLKNDYTTWQQSQKTKKKKHVFKKLIISFLVAVLLLGVGYVLAKGWIPARDAGAAAGAVRYDLKEEGTEAAKTNPVVPQKESETAEKMSSIHVEIPTSVSGKEAHNSFLNKSDDTSIQPVYITTTLPAINDEAAQKDEIVPPVTEGTPSVVPNADKPVIVAPQNENTFGGKIQGLLNKLKRKRIGEMTEDTRSKDMSDKTNISVESFLNGTTGEKGLKVTLHNHSNEIIKTAAVELRYFNEKNGLVDKKILTFTDVPPNGSNTLSTLNNPSAGHTYYRLLSASN